MGRVPEVGDASQSFPAGAVERQAKTSCDVVSPLTGGTSWSHKIQFRGTEVPLYVIIQQEHYIMRCKIHICIFCLILSIENLHNKGFTQMHDNCLYYLFLLLAMKLQW